MNKDNASIAIQVLPKTGDTKSLIYVVDKVIEMIAKSGYNYEVGPFETTVEGDYDGLMDIVKKAQLICIEEGSESVMTYVKIFYFPNGDLLTIDEKTTKHR